MTFLETRETDALGSVSLALRGSTAFVAPKVWNVLKYMVWNVLKRMNIPFIYTFQMILRIKENPKKIHFSEKYCRFYFLGIFFFVFS